MNGARCWAGIAVVWTDIRQLVRHRFLAERPRARPLSGMQVADNPPASPHSNDVMAQQWRELAQYADPIHREIYLAFAATCERKAGAEG
jgi:hypothetical protein